MKKIILLLIGAATFSACNVPKNNDQESLPTSKLEVLTNLGEDSITVAKDTTANHSEAH